VPAGASAVKRREPPHWPSVLAMRHLPRRLHVLRDPSSPRRRGAPDVRHCVIDLGRPSSATPAWGRSGSGLGTMVGVGMLGGWLAGP
jgi:hypothetical protein